MAHGTGLACASAACESPKPPGPTRESSRPEGSCSFPVLHDIVNDAAITDRVQFNKRAAARLALAAMASALLAAPSRIGSSFGILKP